MKILPGTDEHDSWLTEEELSKCKRAYEVDKLRSPVPTHLVSNGEYLPQFGQAAQQKEVEVRLADMADKAPKKLGISRRQVLATSGGMAAAFIVALAASLTTLI